MVGPLIVLGGIAAEEALKFVGLTTLAAGVYACRKEIADAAATAIAATADTVGDLAEGVADTIGTLAEPLVPLDLSPTIREAIDIGRRTALPIPARSTPIDGDRPWWWPTSVTMEPPGRTPTSRTTDTGKRIEAVPTTATPPGPPQLPPIDPKWLKQLRELRDAVVKNPVAKALGKAFKWVTYANGAAGIAKAAICRVTDCDDSDPVAYDLLQQFGVESETWRTILGAYQAVSAVTLVGAPFRVMTFSKALVYNTIGAIPAVVHQLASTDVEGAHVDWNIPTLLAFPFGAMSFGMMWLAGHIVRRFGQTAWSAWLDAHPRVNATWTGFETALPQTANFVRPDVVPSAASAGVFTGVWLALGAIAQPIVSWVENSDQGESLAQQSARRLISTPLEPFFMMGYSTNRWIFVLADNLLFAGSTQVVDPFFSAFDGHPIAVDTAVRKFEGAVTYDEVIQVAREKPLTDDNLAILSDADYSLAPKTWAGLANKIRLDRPGAERLLAAAAVLADGSRGLADHRTAKALYVTLAHAGNRMLTDADRQWLDITLRRFIQNKRGRPLTYDELVATYAAIDAGAYDGEAFIFLPTAMDR